MKVKKQPRVVVVKVKEKILTDVEKQRNKYSLRSKRMFDQPKEREASKRATVKSSSNVRQNRSNLISTEEKKTATCSEKCDSSTVEKQENKYSQQRVQLKNPHSNDVTINRKSFRRILKNQRSVQQTIILIKRKNIHFVLGPLSISRNLLQELSQMQSVRLVYLHESSKFGLSAKNWQINRNFLKEI